MATSKKKMPLETIKGLVQKLRSLRTAGKVKDSIDGLETALKENEIEEIEKHIASLENHFSSLGRNRTVIELKATFNVVRTTYGLVERSERGLPPGGVTGKGVISKPNEPQREHEQPSGENTSSIVKFISQFAKWIKDDVDISKVNIENDCPVPLKSVFDDLIQIRNELKRPEEEIQHLVNEMTEKKYDNDGFKNRVAESKPQETFRNIERIRNELKQRTAEVEKMKIAVKDLKKHVEEKKFPPEKKQKDTEWEICIADVLRAYKSALQSNDRYQNENAELRTRISNLQSEIESIQKVAKSLGAEKEDLVLRLSSIAGAKLTGIINTNIVDLSDPNRPTKLADRYGELFDTEWTDAYEELEKARGLGDRDICVMLVDILLSVHGQCIDIAKRQEKNIYNYLLNPTATTTHTESDTVLGTALTKTITDLRIPTARMSVKNVIKGLQPNDDSLGSILKYRNKCVEICWYMSLQSPPMVLERLNTTQAKFDKDRYSEFTKKGFKVDYVTWPPMLLHEGGPLMCKGVAQGK